MSIGRLRETSQHLAVEGIVLFHPHITRPFLRVRVAAAARGRCCARTSGHQGTDVRWQQQSAGASGSVVEQTFGLESSKRTRLGEGGLGSVVRG